MVASHNVVKVVVKSVGVGERTDKSGKIVKYTGNLYLHFLTKLPPEYDQKFPFSAITVPAHTLTFLPEGGRTTLEANRHSRVINAIIGVKGLTQTNIIDFISESTCQGRAQCRHTAVNFLHLCVGKEHPSLIYMYLVRFASSVYHTCRIVSIVNVIFAVSCSQ